MGGVYIDVSDAEAAYINEYSFRTDIVGGYQLLNGNLARSYARIRKIGDDVANVRHASVRSCQRQLTS